MVRDRESEILDAVYADLKKVHSSCLYFTTASVETIRKIDSSCISLLQNKYEAIISEIEFTMNELTTVLQNLKQWAAPEKVRRICYHFKMT